MDDWRQSQLDWARTFNEDRVRAGRSLEAVAEDVGVALNTLRNYLTAKTRLAPQLLARLAASVDASALRWATILGYLPEELYLAGQSLERAQREMHQLERQLFELRQAGTTTGAVVAAAGTTGRWQVSVEPWFEGPGHCRLRVGDLVRIRACDGRRFTASELRDEPLLSQALTLASATRQSTAVWGGDQRPIADATTDVRDEWIWGVPHLNVSRPAAGIPSVLSVRGLAIFCPLVGGWPGDVASLVGRGLGWASTSSGILSNTSLGEDLRELPFESPGSRKPLARAAIAADLLAHSATGEPTGWAHVSRGAHAAFADALKRVESPTLVVYLRPTDTVHEAMIRRSVLRSTVDELVEARSLFDEVVPTIAFPHLILNVGHPSDLGLDAPMTREKRDAYFERALQISLQLLDHLHSAFHGPRLDALHEDTPQSYALLASQFVDRRDELWLDDALCVPGRRFV